MYNYMRASPRRADDRLRVPVLAEGVGKSRLRSATTVLPRRASNKM